MINPTLYSYLANNLSEASYQNDAMYVLLNSILPTYNSLFENYLIPTNQDSFSIEAQQTQNDLETLQTNVQQNETGNVNTLNTIRAMQVLVVKEYGDVNTFLHNNNIKVSYRFAQYSLQAGYPIASGNIGV